MESSARSRNDLISKIIKVLNNLKKKHLLLYPEEKIKIQTNNLIKISGLCTSQEGSIPTQIFVKIGKRVIHCNHREGNQFYFEFRTGKGFKLIKLYSKQKNITKKLFWILFIIKKKEIVSKNIPIEFNSYLNWLKHYQYHNIKNKVLQGENFAQKKISIITFIQNENSKYLYNFIYWIENQPFNNYELLFCSNKKIKNKQFKKYRSFEAINSSKAAALRKAIQNATGEIILFLTPNIKLHTHSLSLIANTFKKSKVLLCYGDEDIIGEDHFRSSPNFRTTFDPIRIINDNYIGNYIALRKNSIPDMESLSKHKNIDFFHQLILHFIHHNDECIVHIPYILLSVYCENYEKDSIQDFTNEFVLSKNAFDIIESQGFRYFRPKLLISSIYVSIVMPSACDLKYLKPCVESILNITKFNNFEIIILANEIRYKDENKRKYLNGINKLPNINVFKYSNRKFNYSEIINLGVSKATSEYICLMNDDMEVISPFWIEELLSWLSYEDVGIVGAKLLYPDNSLQHAGITIGVNGVCDHLEKNSNPSDYNAHSRIDFPRCFSAVTAGCMVTTKQIFNSVNGFDENLPLTYNDVDFCLRISDLGYKIVFSPFSILYHHESVSVLKPSSIERKELFRKELTYFLTKHEKKISIDPHYSPNQSGTRPYFKLAFPPRLTKLGLKEIPFFWDQRQPIKKFDGSLSYSSKKVAIYSHYDIDNIVDPYVVRCLQELRNQNWIIIFVTSSINLHSKEISKIKNLVTVILFSDGKGRDWGNFALGLRFAYDMDFPKSLLLMNDSLYGPFTSLEEIFDSADKSEADFVGLTDSFQHHYHLQSYFIYCKSSVCTHPTFLNFWKYFLPQNNKDEIIFNNEIEFTKYFSNLGFEPGCLFTYNDLFNTALNGSYSTSEIIKTLNSGTFVNPTHHFADILITTYDFPFIKIELLRENPSKVPSLDLLISFIREKFPDHYKLMDKHLERVTKYSKL